MRYAIFSDVHANLPALEAVLEAIEREEVDQVFCLGDIVGYGAAPRQCVELVSKYCDQVVMGNHDAMTALDVNLHPIRADVAAGLEHAREELTITQRNYLKRLPLVHYGEDVVITHASLEDPLSFEYIDSPSRASAHLERQEEPFGFVGHTHSPAIYTPQGSRKARRATTSLTQFRGKKDRRYVVNVGSVGQPRDRDPRACWVLFDSDMRSVTWHRTLYDIEEAAEAILEAQLPDICAARLFVGR